MRRAFTLIEVLVVSAIIGILAATLTILIGPSMKRKGLETRIRSDLRQFSAAINIYMSDHDGGYPQDIDKDMSPRLNMRVPELDTPTPSPYGGWQGEARYYYPYPWPVQCREKRYDFEIDFDPDVHPITIADFYRQDRGGEETRRVRLAGIVSRRPMKNIWSLGVRLDGSVQWYPHLDAFRAEAIGFSHLPCRR